MAPEPGSTERHQASRPPGLAGAEVWVRAAGDELVIVADLNALALRPDWAPAPPAGLAEVARHPLSTPGQPRIELSHYPGHPQDPSGAPRPPAPKPANPAETAFLALGPGAEAWLIEAAAAGAVRVRAKMAAAVELAALVGRGEVDAALGIGATAGRFAEEDLLAIVRHRAAGRLEGYGSGTGRGANGWGRLLKWRCCRCPNGGADGLRRGSGDSDAYGHDEKHRRQHECGDGAATICGSALADAAKRHDRWDDRDEAQQRSQRSSRWDNRQQRTEDCNDEGDRTQTIARASSTTA